MHIRSQYSGVCRICKSRYAIGESIWWKKGTKGADHSACYNGAKGDVKSPSKPKKAEKRDDYLLSIDYRELCGIYRDAISGKRTPRQIMPYSVKTMTSYIDAWKRNSGQFYGCDADQMLEYISLGYKPEGLKLAMPQFRDLQPKRKLRMSDEGELDFTSALSGFDYPYQRWDKRKSKPAMKLVVDVSFRCTVDAKVIVEYLVWIASMMKKLETEGVDIALMINWPNYNVMKGLPGRGNIHIQVKRPNEKFTFAKWSAIVSPGGARHLMFLSIMLLGDKYKQHVDFGLGMPVGQAFNINFDKERREMQVHCYCDATSFPEAEMTKQFELQLKAAS